LRDAGAQEHVKIGNLCSFDNQNENNLISMHMESGCSESTQAIKSSSFVHLIRKNTHNIC